MPRRPVPHGAVGGLEDVGAVVEGKACNQDAAFCSGEEFADYYCGVADGARGHVRAGPHEIDFGVLTQTALGQDGDDRSRDGVCIQPHPAIERDRQPTTRPTQMQSAGTA